MRSDKTLKILPTERVTSLAEAEAKGGQVPVWEGEPPLGLPDLELLGVYDFEALAELEQEPAFEVPMEILLVDDNPGDVRIVMLGLKEALPAAKLSVVGDGVEAMREPYSSAPKPGALGTPESPASTRAAPGEVIASCSLLVRRGLTNSWQWCSLRNRG